MSSLRSWRASESHSRTSTEAVGSVWKMQRKAVLGYLDAAGGASTRVGHLVERSLRGCCCVSRLASVVHLCCPLLAAELPQLHPRSTGSGNGCLENESRSLVLEASFCFRWLDKRTRCSATPAPGCIIGHRWTRDSCACNFADSRYAVRSYSESWPR